MKARSILCVDVNRVELTELELGEPGPGELCIAAHYTCISPGTELRYMGGRQFEFPYIPGYAMTGRVLSVGPGTRTLVGQAVFLSGSKRAGTYRPLYGGHISHAIVDETAVFPLPEGVDLREASLAMLAAIAHNGVELAPPRDGETVVVVGLGVIGQLSARIHALRGANVLGLDKSAHRAGVLAAAGVSSSAVETSLSEACRRRFPDGVSTVVDATGVPAVTAEAVTLARIPDWNRDTDPNQGSRFVVQGSHDGDVCFPYQVAFQRELTVFVPRNRQARDLRRVLELMAAHELRVGDLVSEVRSPERASETYADLRHPATELMTVAFDWKR